MRHPRKVLIKENLLLKTAFSIPAGMSVRPFGGRWGDKNPGFKSGFGRSFNFMLRQTSVLYKQSPGLTIVRLQYWDSWTKDEWPDRDFRHFQRRWNVLCWIKRGYNPFTINLTPPPFSKLTSTSNSWGYFKLN